MKNTIMLFLLLVMAILASGCGEKGKDVAAQLESPVPPVSSPDNSVTLPNAPVAGFSDHTGRSPIVGTNPTLAECQYIADNYAVGQNQNWYFGAYYDGGGHTLAQANAYNAQHYLRLDRDGVVWRTWTGVAWSNNFITNTWYMLGEHCSMHVVSTTLGIDIVKWDGVVL